MVRKKVSKKATDRNLWRRRIKEMIRKQASCEESLLFKVRGENITAPSTKELLKSWKDIFEKYGFIWGGKWFHYDGMHFEYRPKLILHSRLVS